MATSSVTTPADAVNLALGRVGYRLRVGNLYDGSEASKQALDLYGQTRDELLVQSDWDFAQGMQALSQLKVAPAGGYVPPNVWNAATNPQLPWYFEYAYPVDCLKVRAILNAPPITPNFDPQEIPFELANDTIDNISQKVILANIQYAYCVYTRRVTRPSAWKPGFVEAFAEALARRLAPVLGNLDVAKLEAAEERVEIAASPMQRG